MRAQSPERWEEVLARVGLVAKGVSYGLVGVLAIGVAAGVGGEATSRQGALHQLAGNSFGEIVLVLLAIGFAAYALWRIVQAVRVHEDGADEDVGEARRLSRPRRDLREPRVQHGEDRRRCRRRRARRTERRTRRPPSSCRGRAAPGSSGSRVLVVIGVGLWNLYRGLTRKFEDKWVGGRSTAATDDGAGTAGVAGHVARFVVFALIGVFADQGRGRLQPEGRGRPRRRAAAARASELRPCVARHHCGRTRRVRGLLLRRRALPRRVRVGGLPTFYARRTRA